MTTARDHTNLCVDIRIGLGQLGWCATWLNPVGFDERLKIRFGLCKGSCDIIAIIDTGRFLALEVKTGNAKPTKMQRLFIALVNKFGGYATVVRSVDDAVHAAKEARSGAVHS